MQEVLILSKTHFGGLYCVGGIVVSTNQYVRLLTTGGEYQPGNTQFHIGQVWDIDFYPPNNIIEPHNEDVIIRSASYKGIQNNLETFIRNLGVTIWIGSPDNLFQGKLGWTSNRKGYVNNDNGLPVKSVGFWLSDQDLTLYEDSNGKPRYRYGNFLVKSLPYKGVEPPLNVIPANTLLRVSLAKWWPLEVTEDQDFEPRCYLQLSGWY